MDCPICGLDMTLMREDISFNTNEKQYDRKVFKCVKDDVWISIEIPKSPIVA